ncbi:unnamed protein product [Moneuplotes crassus]|uniref:Uncharacterized protein n=1 Tax=Euplotes crassus TaxID=5936 RepID=A0AAD2D6J2_EUPCR|nr:unnamed protein product [Moneuplotes crassus]
MFERKMKNLPAESIKFIPPQTPTVGIIKTHSSSLLRSWASSGYVIDCVCRRFDPKKFCFLVLEYLEKSIIKFTKSLIHFNNFCNISGLIQC